MTSDQKPPAHVSYPKKGPLYGALTEKAVSAHVVDIDHYRKGMTLETEYVIQVKSTPPEHSVSHEGHSESEFQDFKISKSFRDFRMLASQLRKVADSLQATGSNGNIMSSTVKDVVKFTATICHLVESEPVRFLGKVNYGMVKHMAKSRKALINDVLDFMLLSAPTSRTGSAKRTTSAVDAKIYHSLFSTVETFFLTDHVVDDDESAPAYFAESVAARRQSSPLPTAPPQQLQIRSTSSPDEPPSPRAPKKPSSAPSRVGDNGATRPPTAMKTTSAATKSPSKKTVTIPLNDDPMHSSAQQQTSNLNPISKKARQSQLERAKSEQDLSAVGFELILAEGGAVAPPTPLEHWTAKAHDLLDYLQTPKGFPFLLVGGAILMRFASAFSVTLDADLALFCLFACFTIGLRISELSVDSVSSSPSLSSSKTVPSSTGRQPTRRKSSITVKESGATEMRSTTIGQQNDQDASVLLRKSLSPAADLSAALDPAGLNDDEVVEDNHGLVPERNAFAESIILAGPMERWPDGAELGSLLNRWSLPAHEGFKVRGESYLTDKKKVSSDKFIFPCRGVDLFLTDSCPANVASNSRVFGGHVRDVPTFVINFRLPWGVFLLYFEIPAMFIPFLRARHQGKALKDLPSMADMTPGQRVTCRWLLGDDDHKNANLKLIPSVVKGPWVVRSVVSGKPAIIGMKLPVNYVYQPPEPGKGFADYLEADLDIVASSAARSILSVTRSYTTVLTLDLGLVIQGNDEDELPEQMLCAARLHGVDPVNAPPLPPMKTFLTMSRNSEDEGDGDADSH